MRYTKSSWITIMIALSLILSACNFGKEPEPTPDIGAIFTAAAETVSAQFAINQTQTALAMPTATQPPTATLVPTFAVGSPVVPAGVSPVATFGISTPLATITPLAGLATQAGPVCMDSIWIQDVTYPDYPEPPVVQDDQFLEKIWRIQNTGTCTWDDGFSLVPVTGEAKGSWAINKVSQFVETGETVDVSIDIYTGTDGGEHGGCWKMQGDNGQLFGTLVCFRMIVK